MPGKRGTSGGARKTVVVKGEGPTTRKDKQQIKKGLADNQQRQRIEARDKPMTRKERDAVSKRVALNQSLRKPPQKSGFDKLTSGFLGDRVAEAKELGAGVFTEGLKSTLAISDLLNPGASMKKKRKALGVLGGQAAAVPQGIDAIIPNPSSLPLGDVSLVQWNGRVVPDFWVRGGESEDSKVAKEMWTEHPLASTLTALGTVAPTSAAGATSRIAKTLMKEHGLGRREAFALARKEVRAPGRLAYEGIEGGVEPRVLRSTVGNKTREVTIPQSRSPLGRDLQGAADAVSRKIPNGRLFSERQRANRAIQRATDHAVKAEQTRVANLMRPVGELGYGRFGKGDKPNQALMTYALQSPKSADALAGPKAVKTKLEQTLQEGGYTFQDKDGFVWHDLSPHERNSLKAQVDGITKALENPPDSEAFAQALDALEQVSREAENIGLYVALGRAQGKPPEVAAAIIEAFQERKNLVARSTGQEGDARGFFPHVAAEDKPVASFLGATRRPAVGDTLGVPRNPVTMKENRLILFSGGRLNVDPRVLLGAYFKRQKFLWAETQRRELYHEALPISDVVQAGPKAQGYFVRNPDAPSPSLKPGTKLMGDVEGAGAKAAEILDWEKTLDKNWFDAIRQWREDSFVAGSPDNWQSIPAEWKANIENVRWIPKDVVETRIKPVFQNNPSGWAAPAASTLNSLARIATIQGKPARYVASNTVQSLLMAALSNPRAAIRGVKNQAALARAVPVVDKAWSALRGASDMRSRNPDLYALVKTETGDIAATAGLPEFYVRPQNRMQAVEQKVTKAQHTLGQVLGDLSDNPYRVAVWEQHARRYGIDTDDKINGLLTDETPEGARVREAIRQQTRDDMLDFDRLSPTERMHVSRFLFIWPFMRASLRYPVTFARDYPGRTGIAAATTLGEDYTDGVPTSSRDLFKKQTGRGEYDYGWLVPYGPALEKFTAAEALTRGDLGAVGEASAPWIKQLGKAAFGGGGQGLAADTAARSLVPGYGPLRDILEQGRSGVPVVGRFQPKKGDAALSRTSRSAKQADLERLKERWETAVQEGRSLPDPADAKKAYEAWWDYQEAQRRARYGTKEQGRRSTTDTEKALLLNRVARKHRPDLAVTADRKIRANKDPELAKKYVDWLSRELFAARDRVLNAGRQPAAS